MHDLRVILRLAEGRKADPRKRGSKVHMAVDTLGNLLALHVTPANEQERAQVQQLAQAVQEVTHQHVEPAYVDPGYSGEQPAQAAQEEGIRLEVVKLPEARRASVLLPRRWVAERSFGWMARFRRLAKDYERLATTLVGLHYVAFAFLLLHRTISILGGLRGAAEAARRGVRRCRGGRVRPRSGMGGRLLPAARTGPAGR